MVSTGRMCKLPLVVRCIHTIFVGCGGWLNSGMAYIVGLPDISGVVTVLVDWVFASLRSSCIARFLAGNFNAWETSKQQPPVTGMGAPTRTVGAPWHQS